jgi:hypothetical protein
LLLKLRSFFWPGQPNIQSITRVLKNSVNEQFIIVLENDADEVNPVYACGVIVMCDRTGGFIYDLERGTQESVAFDYSEGKVVRRK